MRLIQTRVVTDDVAGMAGFYARLVDADVVVNDYYVEVPTGAQSVGFSRCRFTDFCEAATTSGAPTVPAGAVVLDFLVDDVDAEFERIKSLGVEWVMPPTDQPWGARSMLLRDPEGHLVNVFSHHRGNP